MLKAQLSISTMLVEARSAKMKGGAAIVSVPREPCNVLSRVAHQRGCWREEGFEKICANTVSTLVVRDFVVRKERNGSRSRGASVVCLKRRARVSMRSWRHVKDRALRYLSELWVSVCRTGH